MRKVSPACAGALVCAVLVLAACGSSASPGAKGPTPTVVDPKIGLTRSGSPGPLPAADQLAAAGRGEAAFALALYGELSAQAGNLAIAPSSIATVLGMVAAGAKGATEQQLVDSLRVPLPAAQLHAAIGGLVRTLAQRSTAGVTLSEVDQTWVQQKLRLVPDFTSTLTRDYAAPLASIDFANPQHAADTINAWVSDQTHGKITKLISPEQLDAAQLVLTDAVYLDAKWENDFDPSRTTDQPFHLADGSTASVPTMNTEAAFAVGHGSGWSAIALPYKGDQLEMDVIVPDDLAQFEKSLDAATLDRVVSSMQPAGINLALPKFEFRTHFDNLKDPLGKLGVVDAFDPDRADFSGITTAEPLYLSAVVHEAFVHVDEEGTVAAGATGGAVSGTSAMVTTAFRVDKPFLFMVRDRATGAIVFLGRVTDPRAN